MNPYGNTREIDISITFRLIDLEAADHAQLSSNGAENQSQLPDLLEESNRSSGKWLTLEQNYWALDGTWELLPETQDLGYWSTELSDGTGEFEVSPKLIVELTQTASSIGFTLGFDQHTNAWPSKYRIDAYNNETLLSTKTVENNRVLSVVDMPVTGYNKVEFTFLETPYSYRRVKMYNLVFGIVQIFDKKSIKNATITEGASSWCKTIQTRELEFTFDNLDHKYNFFNPTGIYAYLQDGQEIQSKILIDGEETDTGTFYYTSATATDGALTAEITANDRVYWLDKNTYDDGQTGTWTLETAVDSILGDDFTVSIDDAAKARLVGKCIPEGTTKREALRLVSQAGRCACWCSRQGTVILRNMDIGTSVDILDADNMAAMDGVSVLEKVDVVKVVVKNEYADTEAEYTAGTGANAISVSNPCVVDGQAVADWILAVKQRRLYFECESRGNPAVEIGDTITIYNAYDESSFATVETTELYFDGGLRETTKALGDTWT